jgi:8-oxo-dGTP pyrophosphatase MutT (NUDIX family)
LAELVELVRGHRGQPEARERLLWLAAETAEPFSRDQFEPGHFTASGFVVSPDGASTLLVYHRRLDRWLQPGGHIDPEDPSAEAAARREVIEETGVRLADEPGVLIDLDVHPIPPGKGEPAHDHFDVRFRFAASATSLDADRSEVRDARWFPYDAVTKVGDDSVRRVVRRLQAGE